jgi:hypothetical protein
MPLKSAAFQWKTPNNDGRRKSRFEIDQFSIVPNFKKILVACKPVGTGWPKTEIPGIQVLRSKPSDAEHQRQ